MIKFFIISLLIFTQTAISANLPDAEIVSSTSKAEPDRSYPAMGITWSLPQNSRNAQLTNSISNFSEVRKGVFNFTPNISLVDFETQTAAAFLNGQGVFQDASAPVSKRGIIILRYGFDNDAATRLFLNAKTMGAYSAVLVTDGPSSMSSADAQFLPNSNGKPGNFSNDIRSQYLKKSGQGEEIKKLLDSGYIIRSPVENPILPSSSVIKPNDFYITMSALQQNLSIGPIMHMKEMILYTVKDETQPLTLSNLASIYVQHGTGNWTRIHMNRTFLVTGDFDQHMNQYSLNHAIKVIQGFAGPNRSSRISQIEASAPLRVIAKNGTFVEVAYTDGRFDLNERISNFLNEAASKPNDIMIKEVLLSHFVFTNKKVLNGIYSAWKAQNDNGRTFKINGMLDAKFVGIRNFGVAATLEGFDISTPFGQKVQGFSNALARDTQLYVDFEEAPGVTAIDPEGPPTDRVLHHDKSTVITWSDRSGKLWAEVFSGSYNNSSNSNNLERQDYFHLRASSPLVRSMVQSIKSAIQLKTTKKVADRLERAVETIVLSRLLGQAPLDLNWNKISQIQELINKKVNLSSNLKKFETLLKDLGSKQSRFMKPYRVSSDLLNARVTLASKFLNWYHNLSQDAQGNQPTLSPPEFMGYLESISEDAKSAKYAIRNILWRPLIPSQTLDSRTFSVWNDLGLKEYFASQGKEGEFPLDKNNIFPLGLLTLSQISEISDFIENGQFNEAAQKIYEITSSAMKNNSQLLDQLASLEMLKDRVEALSKFLVWYQNLPMPLNSPIPTTGRLVLERLFSENLDLVITKAFLSDRFQELTKYILKQRRVDENLWDGLIKSLNDLIHPDSL